MELLIGVCPKCGGVSEVSHPCDCPDAKSPPPCKRNHTAVCDAVAERAANAEAAIIQLSNVAIAVAMKRPHNGSQLDEDLEGLLLMAKELRKNGREG